MPMNQGYKMPAPYRGTSAGKVNTGASGLPSTGIGAGNQGSSAGKVSSSFVSPGSASMDSNNMGSQPSGK